MLTTDKGNYKKIFEKILIIFQKIRKPYQPSKSREFCQSPKSG